ncbi:polysaccharide deacetylase family protein [Hyalangium minutum]|uniref:Polysaccharide deacetylase n=1 Tax=Hyalangium minutum TaxID=394096 RepID=A0A085WB80_9BACT|nr:polysaccharide deacetylase family protein [Hyalangium minutum]KFE64943.1 Polysaccharide deacetylase [Hyalangium minutum]
MLAPVLMVMLLGAAPPPPAGRPLLITVDDLPVAAISLHPNPAERERITRGLLAVLKKHHIQAVGLVNGSHLKEPEQTRLLDLWLADGHELGNHSYSHPSLTQKSAEDFIADVEQERALLAKHLASRGKTLRFFRFPFLREGETLEKLRAVRAYLAESKQRALPVTIDNQDWSFEQPFIQGKPVSEEYQEALHVAVRTAEARGDKRVGGVSPQILLLHANAVGAAEWDRLFTWLEQTGHRFATADEVLAHPIFSEPHEFIGTHGPSLWDRLIDKKVRQDTEAAVHALLRKQAEAWNQGDLEAFCSVYAEDAAFLSPTGLTRGRAQVLARYRQRYPDRKALGTLSFEFLETRLAKGIEYSAFGDALASRVHGVSVVARWTLAYPDKAPATGLTLLVLHRRSDGWEIVEDASM